MCLSCGESILEGVACAGVGKSYFGAVLLARKVLEGREILLESMDETSCTPMTHYYWLSLESGLSKIPELCGMLDLSSIEYKSLAYGRRV